MLDRPYVIDLDHCIACSHSIFLPHYFCAVERQSIGIVRRALDKSLSQRVEKLAVVLVSLYPSVVQAYVAVDHGLRLRTRANVMRHFCLVGQVRNPLLLAILSEAAHGIAQSQKEEGCAWGHPPPPAPI